MKTFNIPYLIMLLFALNPVSFTQVNQDWAARTDSVSAIDIAVDKAGNVYVAGTVYHGISGFNISLARYDPDGNQLWISEYNGIGNGLDGSTALALDTSGNIFVTGYSFRGPAATDDEIVTLKYNPDGDTLWVRHYNSPGNLIDRAFALVVDEAGNSYVGGYLNNLSYGNVYGQDYITIKYSPDGIQLWAAKLDFFDASVTALAVDADGNVYATGIGLDLNVVSHDYITVKYNSSGDSLWMKHYKGLSSDPDGKATAIAVDDSGNIYVTGYSTGSNGYYDYATIKYNGDGAEQWVRRFNGPVNEDDRAVGIVVDNNRNIVVTGEASTVAGSYVRDFATLKYNSYGDLIWEKYYDGIGGSQDIPADIAADPSGSIYITGASIGTWQSGGANDYATIKYNSDGDTLWVQRYDAANLDDIPRAMAVDGSGNVYVTGNSYESSTSSGSLTIKYSQSLTPSASSVEVPPIGAGSTTTFGDTHLTFIGDVTASDTVIVYYYLASAVPGALPSGIIWIGNYYWSVVNYGTIFTNGHMRINAEDLVGVTVGGCGACLVWLKRENEGDPWQNIGGTFTGNFSSGFLTSNIPFDSFSEFAIGSTDSTLLNISEQVITNTYALDQNYPNPFNPSTIIGYQVPETGIVTIKVFNLLGESVATIVNEVKSAGEYSIKFDASHLSSGVYFYQITTGNYNQTKKMIFLR